MLPAGGIPRSFNNSSVSARRSCDCAGLGESSAYSLKKIIIYPNILFNNNFALQLNFLQITVFTQKDIITFFVPKSNVRVGERVIIVKCQISNFQLYHGKNKLANIWDETSFKIISYVTTKIFNNSCIMVYTDIVNSIYQD